MVAVVGTVGGCTPSSCAEGRQIELAAARVVNGPVAGVRRAQLRELGLVIARSPPEDTNITG
jgi:hypothetical protein